jgi:hypothetical protein
VGCNADGELVSKRSETLLGQALTRAAMVVAAEDVAGGRDPDTRANRREKVRVIWKASRLGSTVAAFVIEWAVALQDLDVDELSIERFSKWSVRSRRSVYNQLEDFRRLWPDQDTPNMLALALVRHARAHGRTLDVNAELPAGA